ncbi:MAG: TonB family protein [Candidatus Hydrogenedentota bacterium]
MIPFEDPDAPLDAAEKREERRRVIIVLQIAVPVAVLFAGIVWVYSDRLNRSQVLPYEVRPSQIVDTQPQAALQPGAAKKAPRAREIYSQPALRYPAWAERAHIQGAPRFGITIEPDGSVSRAQLALTSGYPELDRLAEENVRRWTYEPRSEREEREVVVNFLVGSDPAVRR